MSKNRLLIIEKGQLGTLVDAAEWCKHLCQNYDITYVGIDSGKKRSSFSNLVKEKYVPTKYPKVVRGSLFLLLSIFTAIFHRGKIIVVHFPKCSIIKKVLFWKKIHLDIRTLAVSPDENKRKAFDDDIKKSCKYFDSISVISHGIASKLKLSDYYYLPLGSNCLTTKKKTYSDGIRLLYVGTFNGRRIEDTIRGLKMFVDKNPDIPISYTIIGSGKNGEDILLQSIIKELNLEDKVFLKGIVPHNMLTPYFDEANVGVSYVPITEYYQYQPPTKTFEYINSGLFCIATDTASNAEIIDDSNGVLIKDNPQSFISGLERFWENRCNINQDKIESLKETTNWEYIVKNYFQKILNV